MKTPLLWPRRLALSLAIAVAVTGCATTGIDTHPQDPLEPFNRAVYGFNDDLDKMVMQPVAITYTSITPRPVQRGVRNFFANLDDAWSAVNSALQLKGQEAMNSFWRFTINSTLGLGGLLDIASEAQIPKERQDLGHTLNYWGVGTGPYLVLPVLGPSTLRDTLVMPVNGTAAAIGRLPDVSVRNSLLGAQMVNTRAGLLGTTDLLEQAALDPYSFVRDAWLHQRQQNRREQGVDAETDMDAAANADTATTTHHASSTDQGDSTDSSAPAADAAQAAATSYLTAPHRAAADQASDAADQHAATNPAHRTVAPANTTPRAPVADVVHSPTSSASPAVAPDTVADTASATPTLSAPASRPIRGAASPNAEDAGATAAATADTALRISTLELARTTSPYARVRLNMDKPPVSS